MRTGMKKQLARITIIPPEADLKTDEDVDEVVGETDNLQDVAGVLEVEKS